MVAVASMCVCCGGGGSVTGHLGDSLIFAPLCHVRQPPPTPTLPISDLILSAQNADRLEPSRDQPKCSTPTTSLRLLPATCGHSGPLASSMSWPDRTAPKLGFVFYLLHYLSSERRVRGSAFLSAGLVPETLFPTDSHSNPELRECSTVLSAVACTHAVSPSRPPEAARTFCPV